MANQQFERTDRIASEIMRETEKIIREDVSDPRTDCMFSITHVDVTRDLRYAKVYVSVYDKSRSKEVLKGLKSAGGFLRRQLGASLQLRYTPELVFEEDHSIEHGTRIFEILSKLDLAEDEPNDENNDEQGNG